MSGVAAATSLAFTAVGAASSFAGKIQEENVKQQQADFQRANYVYQQQVALQNAALAERQANDALARGQAAEEKRRIQMQQQLGTLQAALAAQGTDLEGSPLDLLGDVAEVGELDARTIRANAEREAYGYRIQALGHTNEATLKAASAANSYYSPNYLGAAGSLLGDAAGLGEKWLKLKPHVKELFASSSPPPAAAPARIN